MSSMPVFVLLPTERAEWCARVSAAGALPVVDLRFAAAEVAIPDGAGVRVEDASQAPGTGPVFARRGLAAGRDTWRETAGPGLPEDGVAGVLLVGAGAGGHAADRPLGELLAATPAALRRAAVFSGPPEALPEGLDAVLLEDVLFAALEPGPRLSARLARLTTADLFTHAGFHYAAPLAAPVRRKLAAGGDPVALAQGWFGADDPAERLQPAGRGLLHARSLAATHGGLDALVAAFVQAAARAGRVAAAPVAAPAPEAAPAPVAAPAPEAPAAPAAPAEAPAVATAPAEPTEVFLHEPVAIVGLGCRLPQAPDVGTLWRRLVEGFDAIIDVPPDRWDPELYWNPDKSAPDKTYARIGGFVTDFQFNPRRFRIPPGTARLIDPTQQMALEASADALDDAGYGGDKPFDRERCAVILGNSMGGEITNEYTLRVMFPALRKALEEIPGFAALPAEARRTILEQYEAHFKERLPPITEDSMPGELSNVVAGRIANALNLGGPNFTTDAACASSMAALQSAVKGLQDGDFDMALTGGVDRSMAAPTYIKFCKIGALSADGSRPFDAGANGFVMGEGAGVLVLKRLSDATRDKDRIYAVIRGIGASSDGKGKGITAPNPVGQMRALRRAYENAGVDPRDVDLFECHGTSTTVGDKVEVDCLTELIGAGGRAARGAARIGSIKSNIGHLKSAAGAASMLKAALALHHKVLPPSIHYRTPRPDLDLTRAPLQVQTAAEPWETRDVRRVGVSSFGFGGTNFHVVVEEHRPELPAHAGARVVWTAPPEPAPAEAPAPPAPAEAAPAALTPAGDPVTSPLPSRPFAPERPSTAVPVPDGIWALSADTPEDLIARCRALKRGHVTPYEPDAQLRLVAAADGSAERDAQLDKAIAALQKGKGYDLLRSRGIYLEDVPCDGQLAFVFTGQGSQYVGMGLDLAEVYPVVAETFREADRILEPLLGKPLTWYLRPDPARTEDEQFEVLRQTEISQPATLTVDVAIMRLLAAFGVRPDVVAGHSLGEYGAAVAAGMLTFEEALVAVSARGREMAAVKLDDFGKMAGIATSVETVEALLAEIPGYVVAANKNCPTQTVIAGESDAVDAAVEAFKSRGITVYPLPVSHAFHSRIVAPASEPLRRVLEKLDLQAPKRRITTNVDSRYYPTGEGARQKAIDILARQVASPVEWIAQIERMYADGARIFVECGPKRALTGFVVSILKQRPHRALYTNQPKRGGVQSFRDALAALLALGFPVDGVAAAKAELFAESGARRSTSKLLSSRAESRSTAVAAAVQGGLRGVPMVEREILAIVAQKSGYPVDALDIDFELEADLGIDTVKQADIVATVRDRFHLEEDAAFRFSDYRTLRSLIDYAGRRIGATRPASLAPRRAAVEESPTPTLSAEVASRFLADVARSPAAGLDATTFAEAMLPALQGFLAASWQAFAQARAVGRATGQDAGSAASGPAPAPVVAPPQAAAAPALPAPAPAPRLPTVVCAGASVGLPGGQEVFAPDNVERILRGENRIGVVPEEQRARMVEKGVVRLIKDSRTGQGEFVKIERTDEVIRLAGMKAHFDLVRDYGVDPALARALDVTTQLAFAAGLEALRDAGIPLVRTWRTTTTGKNVATGWALPPSMREETGVVFASAFPGYDFLLRHLAANADDGEGHFDRRFLFQILSMGHSQFAQFVQAKGPNTQVNAACASTTQAIAIAEDWIKTGRCRRVILIGADDVTGENLLQWIGAGFLAAGAATTEDKVENAALPFDRRRHGMILGMGAVGMILEAAEATAERGMAPVAELLGTRIANSAFHGTRLDQDHISGEVRAFARDVLARAGVSAEEFTRRCVFLSHETYTPARGGSAAAEMASLPAAFGDTASRILIANTKGFTGHAMGAGIEDTVAVKALQYRVVPPIANLREPDPDLGNLSLSQGGPAPVDYALRLAAGFGSQLALAAWKRAADGDRRVTDSVKHDTWLTKQGGQGRLVVESRQLRWVEDSPPSVATLPTAPSAAVPVPPPAAAPVPAAVPAAAPVARPAVDSAAMVKELVELIARKSGYDPAEVDPSYELEADLGIDTVKQAEIFGEMRERHGLARDDSFKLADFPTVEKLAGYLAGRVATGADPVTPVSVASPASSPHDPTTPLPPEVAAGTARGPASGGAAAPTAVPVAPVVGPSAPTRVPAADAPDAADAATAESVLTRVLAVIARRTGYDPAELDPDYELEADLGIDTVKQAEIFGEVREHYGLARDDEFKLADHPTIRKLSGYLAERARGGGADRRGAGGSLSEASPTLAPDTQARPAAPPPPPVTLAAPTAVPAAPSPTLVAPPPSAPSGAAAAPAGGDVRPEAVLTKLLHVVAARTGYEPSELDPDYELEADLGIDTVKQAEIFGEVRAWYGLARDDDFKLADYPTIRRLSGYLATRAAQAPAAPAAPPVTAAPAAATEPPRGDTVPDEDESDPNTLVPSPEPPPPPARLAAPVAELPSGFRVRRPVKVARAANTSERLEGRVVRVLGDGARAEAVRAELLRRGARLDDAADVVIDCGADLLDAFHVAKALDAAPPLRWMAVVDGALDAGGALAEGSRSGLAKALGREWPRCRGQVLTVPAELTPEDAAVEVADELGCEDGFVEVWRDVGERQVAMLDTEPLPARAEVDRPRVVLLTGGTRGITARVARAFAAAGPCSLVLVGRTGGLGAPLDEEAAKSSIKRELSLAGARVTPRMVEDRLKPLRAAEEVRQNVAELRALGATVEVVTLDVSNPAEVRTLVARLLEEYGGIDVCVHGAGVEESRKLADKDDAAFARVYDGKAKGGLALAEALPVSTFLVSMGSVAGRFGNAGQVDYAAANDGLAGVCRVRPNSLHVAWTAWADTGMAVRGGMESLLTSRGVELLPAEPGARLVVDLVGAAVTGEIVVAGALGDFPLPSPHPLLDRFELDGDAGVGRVSLSVERAPWIVDHAIEGTPVLPGVIGIELMAAVALGAWPRGRFAGATEVRFDAPVKLHRDEPVELEIRAWPGAEGAVRCELSSRRTLRTGRVSETRHFSAWIQLEEMPLLPNFSRGWMPPERVDGAEIYRRFFHGPRFQVLRHADAVAVQGVTATAVVDHSPLGGALLSDPLVIEAAFQAAGLHGMLVEHRVGLPMAVDAVAQGVPVTDGDPLTVTAVRRGEVYDIDVDGPEGRVLTMRGFRLVERESLPPERRFPAPLGGWLSVGTGSAVEAREHLPPAEVAAMTGRGNTKRQEDRLAGQYAAFRALEGLAPGVEVKVRRRGSGEPEVLAEGHPELVVSISHVGGQGLAVAGRGVHLGVDWEENVPRPASFAREWFTEREQGRFGTSAALTRAWAVKEAVLKALGTGMALSPREVEVETLGEQHAVVTLRGEAAARHAALGGATLRVQLGEAGGRVVALALFAGR